MMEMVYYPNPLLKQIAQPIKSIDDKLESIVADMFVTMFKYKGCGLAAPQVGLSQRILVYTHTGDLKWSNVLINPKILEKEGNELKREGCLSFPKIYGAINRSEWIKVETLTLKGELRVFEAEGFHARVIQHEIDHLDGILFTERMVGLDLFNAEIDLKKLRKKYK